MRKLWIRPVHCKDTDRLLSMAVCTTPYELLVDEQILCHFPMDASGREIKEEYGEDLVLWGPSITA